VLRRKAWKVAQAAERTGIRHDHDRAVDGRGREGVPTAAACPALRIRGCSSTSAGRLRCAAPAIPPRSGARSPGRGTTALRAVPRPLLAARGPEPVRGSGRGPHGSGRSGCLPRRCDQPVRRGPVPRSVRRA
jgi:hypothetical protein